MRKIAPIIRPKINQVHVIKSQNHLVRQSFKDRVLLPATPQDDERPLAQDTGGNGGLVHQAPALRALAATNPSLNQKNTRQRYLGSAMI
jgi:hypothetical protein